MEKMKMDWGLYGMKTQQIKNMKVKNIVFRMCVLLCIVGCKGYAQKNYKGIIRVIDYQELEAEQLHLKKGDKKAVENYKELLNNADQLLDVKAYSVVNKTGLPPSKNKHDYMSIGPYWWPNPNTDDGLPYIRKDGEINPETRNDFTDFVEKNNFISAVTTLSEAYFFSDKKQYATKSLALINTWFLNEETRMNPNVNFGQYVPGKSEGRCFGIIEFDGITTVIQFLELAKDRNILDKKTEDGMLIWFTEYSDWLKNSKLGKEEATRKNNHGTHYDVQLLNILVYLNKIEEVKKYLSTVTKNRIFSQIEPDGSQPLELARTKSFSYSVMNLHGFLELAKMGQKVGIDLWNVTSQDGRSIKKGYQYMIPYVTGQKEWKHQQIINAKSSEEKLIRDLKFISKNLKDTSFDKVLHQLNQKNKKH
ncbi:alginate lyase family protein [Lutibacter sp. A64]|uniref:alginate lyase family protein n=1 Tax=Lutibacter sp. A64 TaxID=2918526 RepID=UPI001F051AA7|nr:alginate lyase family protein [Lutibacter sp. A64]UMB54137.1 alginate lyase family protein [Lutibacter sp. A64]